MADKEPHDMTLVELYESMTKHDVKEEPMSISEHLRQIDAIRGRAQISGFSEELSRKVKKALDRGWKIKKIEVSQMDIEITGLPDHGTFMGIPFEEGETTQLHLEANV